MAHILIVDDDERISRSLNVYLRREGYDVSIASDGASMWTRYTDGKPDLILLDIGLPDTDGITLARELRARSDVGIIMLTGRDDPVDTIIGLEIGADDYVTKPFDDRQLLARIRSVLRRRLGKIVENETPQKTVAIVEIFEFDGWKLNSTSYELESPAGEIVELTHHEYKLLELFVRNPGMVLSREQLLQKLSNREWVFSDRSIDVIVGKLRKKIEKDHKKPKLILTIRSFGYKFTPKVTKHSRR